MAAYLMWAIAGFVLIIAELLTGTFYLLVIGVAALAAAIVAYFSGDIWVQVMISAAMSVMGVYAVNRWRANHAKDSQGSSDLNIGHSVVIESWVDEAAGRARVKYRGSTWDAKVDTLNPAAKLNDVLYIHSQDNGVLNIGIGVGAAKV